MPARQAQKQIIIPRPDLQTMDLDLIGLSPLMVNRFSEKARDMIAKNQEGKAKLPRGKREPRDPEAEFRAASYRIGDDYAFPAGAFRKAAISACRLVDGVTMTLARQLFICPDEFVILKASPNGHSTGGVHVSKNGNWPEMDTRAVRLESGVADIRYRPIFWPWQTTLRVRYFAGATSPEQIANLLMLAGECVGIGELRPERGGNFGRFTLASEVAEQKPAKARR